MKTWARAKVVAGNAVKKVAKVVMPEPKPVPRPEDFTDYANMTYTDLKLCARNEGIRVGRKKKSELISELYEAWENEG